MQREGGRGGREAAKDGGDGARELVAGDSQASLGCGVAQAKEQTAADAE